MFSDILYPNFANETYYHGPDNSMLPRLEAFCGESANTHGVQRGPFRSCLAW